MKLSCPTCLYVHITSGKTVGGIVACPKCSLNFQVKHNIVEDLPPAPKGSEGGSNSLVVGLSVIAGMLVMAALISFVSGVGSDQPKISGVDIPDEEVSSSSQKDHEWSVYYSSKAKIRGLLKYPHDASFADQLTECRQIGDKAYYCSSHVEAKNEYGGIHTYLWSTMIVGVGNDRWECVYWSLGDEPASISDNARLMSHARSRIVDKGYLAYIDIAALRVDR